MNAVPQELRETVQMLKGVWADPSARGGLEPDLAKTFGLSTGFQPYDLAPYAVILQPVFSPIRNRLTRNKRKGKNYEFKAVTAVDTSGQTGVAAEGTVAGQIATQVADINIGFESFGLSSDPVTYEQLWAGQGMGPGDFDIDSRALSVANLLKAVMIAEEKLILYGVGAAGQITSTGGMSWTFGGLVGNASNPTLAAGTSGSLTGTVYVKVTQLTGMGESLPSAAVNNAFGTASNGSLTVTPVAKAGVPVQKYNVYASTDGVTYKLQGSTNGSPFTIKVVGNGAAPPTADASGSTNAFAGIMSYLFATGSGAQLNPVNGALTSLDPLNVLLENIWNTSFGDPDDIWLNSHEIRKISSLLVGSGSPYYLSYEGGGNEQRDIIGNARVSRVLNPVTSKILPLNVHAYLAQGTILVTSTELPAWYIGNNVPSVWGMELTQDYIEIDYEPTRSAPTWQSEIRCFGGLSCYVPSVNGAVYGIDP